MLTDNRLVMDTLKNVSTDRKCFRMVGGVLIEKTVAEVLPALQTNSQGLTQVIDTLKKDYVKTEEELKKWQQKNNVQIVSS